MKKYFIILTDHIIGLLAAAIYYLLLSLLFVFDNSYKLFKRKKKVKPPDKKMYFNDPFSEAWFNQKKKRFNSQ